MEFHDIFPCYLSTRNNVYTRLIVSYNHRRDITVHALRKQNRAHARTCSDRHTVGKRIFQARNDGLYRFAYGKTKNENNKTRPVARAPASFRTRYNYVRTTMYVYIILYDEATLVLIITL